MNNKILLVENMISRCHSKRRLLISLLYRSKHNTLCESGYFSNSFDSGDLSCSLYQTRTVQKKSFDRIPGPSGLPYVGSHWQFKFGQYSPQEYHKALLDKYHKYGDIFKEAISGETIVHLFDPDHARLVLNQTGNAPHIPPLLAPLKQHRKNSRVGLGLGNLNGKEWSKLRKQVNTLMLKPRSVERYLPNVNDVVTDHLDMLSSKCDENGCVHNLNNEMAKLNLEIAAMNCFQRRLGLLDSVNSNVYQRIIDANAELFEHSTSLKFSLNWYKIATGLSRSYQRLIAAENILLQFITKSVDETIASLKTTDDLHNFPFFSSLLAIPNFPMKDVYVMTLNMLTDGQTSVAPTTLFLLHNLAKHQRVQQKLHSEVERILPQDKTVTPEVLRNATYLKACIKETFRMYPVQSDIARLITEDTTIAGYDIPAGTSVQLNMAVLLRHNKYFDRPDEFLPERWLRGTNQAAIDPFLVLPFSHGVRMCIGRRIAEQEMLVHMLKLVNKFELSLEDESEEIGQDYYILNRPNKEIRVKFTARQL